MALLENFAGLSVSRTWLYTSATLGLIIAWQAATIIYNLFFHPLRDFPGPLFHRASPLAWAYRQCTGDQAFNTQRLHERYGPVVRIGPNHLSFTDPAAWKDIYGHRVGGDHGHMTEMAKAPELTRTIRSLPRQIVNADREEHQRLRRALAHGFSDSSIRQQEPLISKYVDLLMKRLGQECEGGGKVLNLEAWYNYTTFDVVGNLVFGQSFGCLEGVEYHPWIASIFKAVRMASLMVSLSYMGFDALVQAIFYLGGLRALAKLRKYTDGMVHNRLKLEKGRNDLFEGLVQRKNGWNMSFDDLSSNAFVLVLAGSETTATTLSGATYLLLTHREVLEKLNHEVRSIFKSAEEININSVNKLEYMLATLNETLRLYPPVTSGLVRIVPPRGEHIAGHYVPGGSYVEVQHWSANHSKDNWADPWVFRPERFLCDAKEASAMGNKLEALQAFSVGPRNCIGRNLAYAEMRLILARIIYNFDMRLAEDSKKWIDRQSAYGLWDRIPLNVYLTKVKRDSH